MLTEFIFAASHVDEMKADFGLKPIQPFRSEFQFFCCTFITCTYSMTKQLVIASLNFLCMFSNKIILTVAEET